MEEKDKKIGISDCGILMLPMFCGLIVVCDNRLPFVDNIFNWVIYGVIFLIIMVLTFIFITDPKTKLKFWLKVGVAALVCIGLCWLWQAPAERDLIATCTSCNNDIPLNYDASDDEFSHIAHGEAYCYDCAAKAETYEYELNWFMENAVLVTETGSRYHRSTCQYVQDRDYWIYNIENAEYQGYSPCKVCFSGNYDWTEHLD